MKNCRRETQLVSWKCSMIHYIIHPASHLGGVGSIPAQDMWDLCWECLRVGQHFQHLL
jgi:hypothetical protein